MKRKLRLVIITWEDSILGFAGWKSIKDQSKQREKMISVGFVMNENKYTITLYPHLQRSNQNGAGDIIIPKSAIRKIKQLKP
jgi:hypothetical protein